MNDGQNGTRKGEKSEVMAVAKRGEPYRAAVREVVPTETWRAIVEAAYQEASRGDDRARDWLLRVLGVADAARVDATIRIMSQRVLYSQFLDEVEEALVAKAREEGRMAPEAECSAPKERAIPPFAAPEITYWSVVFDVVTPRRWRVVVDVAQRQALQGDPRAREWLTRVFGAEGACQELGAADARSAVVTFATLAQEWANEDSAR